MTNGTSDIKCSGDLLKVLTAHYRALVSARSDEMVLRQYSALLRFLRSDKCEFLKKDLHAERHIAPPSSLSLSDEEIRKASLGDIETIVNNDATTRRDLERIAIQRFSVPRGSMRRFSNRKMLLDKLLTLIDNERTHETIGSVARGEGKRTADPGDNVG